MVRNESGVYLLGAKHNELDFGPYFVMLLIVSLAIKKQNDRKNKTR